MIELNEWQLSLLQRLEKENYKRYIKIFENHYYARIDDLFYCIDDTQDNREYAEEKLKEYINETETKKEDEIPGLLKSYQKEYERLKEENEILRNKALMVCNEDMLDKLANEGIEFNE